MKMITCIHPSRSRPDLAKSTAKKWIDRAGIRVEYILSVDVDDPYVYDYSGMFTDNIDVSVIVNLNKSAIQAINVAAKKANGDLLVVVSDDFDCPENWAIKLIEGLSLSLADDWTDDDFIVKTKDGMQPTIITLPILSRKYYERFGYVYFEGYNHLFCDTEMTAVAHMTGKVINSDLMFRHNHYLTGAMKKDDINIKNDSTWKQGENLFNERKAINFGLKDEDIVKPYSAIRW